MKKIYLVCRKFSDGDKVVLFADRSIIDALYSVYLLAPNRHKDLVGLSSWYYVQVVYLI